MLLDSDDMLDRLNGYPAPKKWTIPLPLCPESSTDALRRCRCLLPTYISHCNIYSPQGSRSSMGTCPSCRTGTFSSRYKRMLFPFNRGGQRMLYDVVSAHHLRMYHVVMSIHYRDPAARWEHAHRAEQACSPQDTSACSSPSIREPQGYYMTL